jgi:hypothetical protein
MGGNQSVLVNLHQRKVMKDYLHLIAIFFFDLLQLRIKLTARRTLIIAILLHHHGRTDFDVRPG